MRHKVKFKKGDNVRILPSAVDVNVSKAEVGKVGVVLAVGYDVTVKTATEKFGRWYVRYCDITPVIKVGQQLEFSFMQQS